jgi:hypothetical protein
VETIVSTVKYLSYNDNIYLASLTGGFPIGLISSFFIDKSKLLEYYNNYIIIDKSKLLEYYNIQFNSYIIEI